ncbi:hypothetical protein CY34DRAFT_805938 [Suillus luteus UH-Slu-Lm8-n1]|uniref:Uncharacterized protein n=1 Tax=Suillus luteus UH-Slu-Lm8-n1 TaxID=930992 RepID=A0A0C9ZUN8_9AGAM|nr:hypothetical protein CY34DRAFT_805938 [Suillus luteus UH-Slu-Lm8-n1]
MAGHGMIGGNCALCSWNIRASSDLTGCKGPISDVLILLPPRLHSRSPTQHVHSN